MNDYARQQVPDSATVPGFRIAIVIFGVGATLPIFYIGSSVGLALGLYDAVLTITLSCLLVSILMLATSIIGARARLSTYMLVQLTFGRATATIINLIMFIMLVGYFSITAEIFGGAMSDMLSSYGGTSVAPRTFAILGGVLMSLTAIFGFGVLERFAVIAVPILALFMCTVLFVALLNGSDLGVVTASTDVQSLTIGTTISTIIGANILMAVSGPDFARFARNDKEALKSVTGLLVGFPIIMITTAIPSMITGEVDVMKIMLVLGLAVPAFIVLTVATWTTNTVNVYSAVLTLTAVFPRVAQIRLAILAAVIGIAGAAIGVLQFFFEFAIYLGLIATPIAGIYVVDFYVLRRKEYCEFDSRKIERIRWPSTLMWLTGAGWSILAYQLDTTISSIPAVDGLVLSMVGFLALQSIVRRKK